MPVVCLTGSLCWVLRRAWHSVCWEGTERGRTLQGETGKGQHRALERFGGGEKCK